MLLAGLAGAAVAAPGRATAAARGARREGFSAARLGRLDAYLDAATGARGHLGAVALLARDGQVVHWKAYGRRDLARREPMPRDAIVRLYSMTKPVTSVVLLTLLEEGRVRLDDPVAQHLPAFADIGVFDGGSADAPRLRPPVRPPTVRHLLTHTTGFAVTGPEAARALLARAAPHAAADLDGYARRAAAAPLAHDPGTRFAYDGIHTEVLSRLIEVVVGAPFETVLRTRILDPLGMADTGFTVPPARRHRIADLTAVDATGALVLAPQDPSAAAPGTARTAYASGAGGLYGTAHDYFRFAQMLLDGGRLGRTRIVSRTGVALMTMHHLAHLEPIDGLSPGEGFGLGVAPVIDVARRGRLASVGAYGWPGAAQTTFTVDPAERMIAILLLQHLPRDAGTPGELPRHAATFHNLVYQALDRW